MKKILALIGIIFLFSLMFVPLVSASYVCPAAYTVASGSASGLIRVHPSVDGYDSQFGMAFTANASAYLYNVTFQLAKFGNPTCQLEAILWSVSGTVGTNAKPSVALQVSDVVEASSLTTSKANITFTFDGTYQLQSSVDYALTICVLTSGATTTNYVIVYFNNVGADATKNFVDFRSSNWYYNTDDAYFIVNGDSSGSGATPTPTPVPSTSTGDVDIENLTAIILPWLVPLLICLIPALLGYKFVGELGFFIGLNVGCILAYVTLSGTAYAFPLWGIILVGVMDVAVVLMRR